MKIEILYPEVGNLFGDSQTRAGPARLSLPEAELIETDLTARPAFADTDVDMIHPWPDDRALSDQGVISSTCFRSGTVWRS